MGILSIIKRKKTPTIYQKEEYSRGFYAASESIANGEDPQTLYDQSLSDCDTSNPQFTFGWQVACCQYMAEELTP